MSIHVQWANDHKTIMLWTFKGQWTWDDFFVAQDYDTQLMSTVTHRVDIIADLRKSPFLPGHAYHFSQFQRALQRRPHHAGIIVIVGANLLVRMLFDSFSRIHRGFDLVSFVGTPAQAYRYLAKRQQENPV